MSNLYLNIRFGEWHLKVGGEWPWVSVSHNPYHAEQRRSDPAWRWFEVH